MINEKNCNLLKEKYGKDFYHDLLLHRDEHITFFIDFHNGDTMMHITSGDVSTLGMTKKDVYSFDEFMSFIEPNNLLAEIEGRHTFLEDIKRKVLAIEKELYLYIPIKRSQNPLWLSVNLDKMPIDTSNFIIFGRVYRVHEHTPTDIIHYQKTYQDSLTRLFTRETLKLHLDNLKDTSNSYGLYIDIDGFKMINDIYGHDKGDQFLIKIANHFINHWEHNVMYYRLGGDEFFVYVYDHTKEQVLNRAQNIITDIELLDSSISSLHVSASIGIVPINDITKQYHALLNLGDHTMYTSKNKGRGNITFYNEIK
jgi:diguanylate cyclase (GGDEF)-like protein